MEPAPVSWNVTKVPRGGAPGARFTARQSLKSLQRHRNHSSQPGISDVLPGITYFISGETSEQKAGLNDAAWLINLKPAGAKNGDGRSGVSSVNYREVSANEKGVFDISRSDGKREGAAAGTKPQRVNFGKVSRRST